MEIIRVYSDLHNDGLRRSHMIDYFDFPKTLNEENTILVLAGDIDDDMLHLCNMIENVSKRFKYVILVPGNHEYYRVDMASFEYRMSELSNRVQNFICLDNSILATDDYIFVGSTLWFDVPENDSTAINIAMRGLNDFHYIKTPEGDNLNIEYARYLNRESKDYLYFLGEQYRVNNDRSRKLVAITHHCPTMELVRPEFRGDPFNHVFHNTGMEKTIELYDYWIYGHNHDAVDTEILGCNLISNALGYYLRYQDRFEVQGFVDTGLVLFDERLYGVE